MNKTISLLLFLGLIPFIVSCGGGGDNGKPSGPITPDKVAVTSVSLSKTTSDLEIGSTLQLSATVSPSNATDKSVTWSSSNASAATVTPTGLVTGKAEGSSNITATAGGKSATCKVTVKKPAVPVTSVELDQTELSLKVGESKTLNATVKPDNATDKTITWGSSKPDIVSVDNNGKVTAISKGTASITASCGSKSASCKINVMVPVESVTLSSTSLTMIEGDTQTLIATVVPDDASNKTITWSSSNTSIVSVDNSGKVTAIKEGTALITATCEDKNAQCQITVSRFVAVESVTLNLSYFEMAIGTTSTLTATIIPDNATDKTLYWTTTDSEIAQVDNNGKITAMKRGYVWISAGNGDKWAHCRIYVFIPISSISLDKSSVSLRAGYVQKLNILLTPSDADYPKDVTWSSSNNDVATVKSNGEVTAISPGTAIITANASGKAASCTVIVFYDSGIDLIDRDEEDF